MRRSALVLMIALGLKATGCACTAIGCLDGFGVTITVDASMVPAGTHTLNVTADGTVASCTFTFPPPDGPNGVALAQCSGGLVVSLQPAMTCTTVMTSTGTMNSCQTIGGEFAEYLMLPGTPSSVRVQQAVDGDVILDQTLAPTYQTVQPNGASCGPTCHEAGASLTIP